MSNAILEVVHLFPDEPAEIEPSHEEQDFASLADVADAICAEMEMIDDAE
jgi:hypothetical protein